MLYLVIFPSVEDISGCYLRRYVASQTGICIFCPCTSYIVIFFVQFNTNTRQVLSQFHQSANSCEAINSACKRVTYYIPESPAPMIITSVCSGPSMLETEEYMVF